MPQTFSLAQLPASYSNSVQLQETDQMGHMNVRFYVQKSWLAICTQLGLLGYDETQRARQKFVLHLREQHIRFLAEQHPGTPYYVVGGVCAHTAQSLTLYQEMRHRVTDVPFATFTSWLALEKDNRPVAWPKPIRDGLPYLGDPIPPHGQPRGITLTPAGPKPTLAQAQKNNMTNIWLGPVLPELCDMKGHMQYWSVMGILSDAIPTLLAILYKQAQHAPQHGSAALEYRLRYYKRLPQGSLVGVYSGLRGLGSKTFDWIHWLFDMQNGQAFATAQAISIGLDLETRKALSMDPQTRAQFEQFCLPNLSV